jgi:flagellar hook-associated protein 2
MGKSTDSLVSFTSANKNAQPGSYAVNITQLATQGKLVGSAAPTYIIDDSNKTLTFKVDGNSATVTLGTGNYSPKQLIAEIQSKVNGAGAISSAGSSVTVGFDGTQAKLTGSTAANLAAAGGTTLNIGLDGGTGQDITLAASYATPGDLVNDLQSKINTAFGAGKIQVDVKDGVLSLTSPSYGSTSQITLAGTAASALFGATTTASGTGTGALTITSNKYGSTSDVTVSGDGASTLFGAARTNTVGVNVAGTIGGNPALGSGQDLTGSSGGADGLKLTIKGDTIGDRGTVTFDRGFAQHLDQVLTGLLDSKGIFNAKTDGINATIKDIGKRRDELSTRLTALEARYRAQYTALDTLMS